MKFNQDNLNIHEITIEDPEEKWKGRDPEEFLNKVTDWLSEREPWNTRGGLDWDIIDDGKVVYMWLEVGKQIPLEYIDVDKDTDYIEKSCDHGFGIDELIKRLKNKRVLSVNKNGKWYLEIIDEKKENLQPETQQIPEIKQF